MVKVQLLILGILLIVIGAAVSGGTAFALGFGADSSRPGLGLGALCAFDMQLIYGGVTLALHAIGLGAIVGRVQWIGALVVGLISFIFCALLLIAAFTLLNIMLALFLSIPFGTAVYLTVFGTFDTDLSRSLLAVVMTFKMIGLALMVVAAPGLLRNRQMLVLSGISIVFTVGLGFVHALVPDVLVSIADAVAAIIILIVALVFFALLTFGGIGSLVRALRGLLPT